MATNNYYMILDIKRNATQAEIKKSYRRLAKKYHPDVSKEANAESKFKEIAEAYETLKNKQKRTSYDLFGSSAKSTHKENNSFTGFDPSIFGDFFKQAPPSPKKPKKPANQSIVLKITLEDTTQGVSKEVELKNSKIRNVTIPKGIKAGEIIRLVGKAESGGDLLLTIEITPQQPKPKQKPALDLQKEMVSLIEELGEVNNTLLFEGEKNTRETNNIIEYRFETLLNELEQETNRLAEFGGDKGIKTATELQALIETIRRKIQTTENNRHR